MIHSSFSVGSVAGIRVRIHGSTILLALLPFLSFGSFSADRSSLAASFATIGLLFATLVFHEFGHALAARWRGLAVTEIVLLPVGGYTRTAMEAGDWRSELVVVAAGPMVNLVLAGVAFAFVGDAVTSGAAFDTAVLAPGEAIFTRDGFFLRVLFANAVLGILNLVPAWPLDGGRILRATLVPFLGLVAATRAAARTSQVLAVLVLAASTRNPSFMLMASIFVFFCWRQATLEERRVRLLDSHRRALAARAPDGSPREEPEAVS